MSELGDIGDILDEKPVARLDWLEVSEEDYRASEVLPKQNLDAIPELEAQWKALSDADKYRLSPENREPSRPNTPFWSEKDTPSHLSDEDVAGLIAEFARREVQAGATAREVVARLQGRFDRQALAKAKQALKDVLAHERGLLGAVYLDAALFEDCHQGHAPALVPFNRQARFVLAKDTCGDCIHNREGRCAVLKKEIVMEVQYDPALWQSYEDGFRREGKDVAKIAHLPVRERLRTAFQMPAQAPAPEVALAEKPVERRAPRMSWAQAQALLAKAPGAPAPVVADPAVAKKLRATAHAMMAGRGHDRDLVARVQSDPDLAPLRPHLHVLGHLYLDLSFFPTRQAAQAFQAKLAQAPPFTVGAPGDAVGQRHAGESALNIHRPDVIAHVARRFALVKVGPHAPEAVQRDMEARAHKALRQASAAQAWDFARRVYAEMPAAATGTYDGPYRQAPAPKVSERQVRDYMASLRQAKTPATLPVLEDYLKDKGGDGLLRVMARRVGLDNVKQIFLANEGRVADTVRKSKTAQKAAMEILSAVLDRNYRPSGLGAPTAKMAKTKMGRWLRDQMVRGKTGADLSGALRDNFSVAQLLGDTPVIIAYREEEGLYGSAYITADSYDDCTAGTREVGAGVTQVVASSKCQSCVYNKVGKCLLYAKSLVAAPTYDDGTVEAALSYRTLKGHLGAHDAERIRGLALSAREKTRMAHLATSESLSRHAATGQEQMAEFDLDPYATADEAMGVLEIAEAPEVEDVDVRVHGDFILD